MRRGWMRVARLDEVGPPENLKIVEAPIPEPGPQEVLIKTALAGVIYGDLEACRGTYFKATTLPFFPGREVAGDVVAIGEDVTNVVVGDRVLALTLGYGCWAEYVVVSTVPKSFSAGHIVPPADMVCLDPEIDFADALPYLVNFRLAHMLFHGSSQVSPAETVLVHGGSGGMGSMVIQLAMEHGCTSIATCRSYDEAEYCKALGATHVIRTDCNDYVEAVKLLTDGRGVPYSFNGVGGESLNRDFDVLQPFGELQAYGYVAGKADFETFRLGKTISLKTFSADNFLKTPMFAAATTAMHEWFRRGGLHRVDCILPLEDVVEANRMLEEGRVMGKVALRP